jgi:hypothetical protein
MHNSFDSSNSHNVNKILNNFQRKNQDEIEVSKEIDAIRSKNKKKQMLIKMEGYVSFTSEMT